MHFYLKILHGQSWIFSTMPFYGKFLIELEDGECIHQILGFTAGCSIPCPDVLLKIYFFQLIFPRITLVFSGREWSPLERPASQFEKHYFGGKKKDFKTEKHSQSNRSRP